MADLGRSPRAWRSAAWAVGLLALLTASSARAALLECSYGTPTADGRRFGDNVSTSFGCAGCDPWGGGGGYDDGSMVLDLRPVFPEGLPFFGVYQTAFLNINGNISFSAPSATFTPDAIPGLSQPTIAAFFADVDLRNASEYGFGPGAIYVCHETAGDVDALRITWWRVGYYSGQHDRHDTFQLSLVNTDAACDGSFEVELRYEKIEWTTGDASGGMGGQGGQPATAGFDRGNHSRNPNDAVALLGSGTSAVRNLPLWSNVDDPGVFRFRVAGGVLPQCGNGITDRCEVCDDGNASNQDGCTNLCELAVCGDGLVRGGGAEQCDDGNTAGGDGCSATCAVEVAGVLSVGETPGEAQPGEEGAESAEQRAEEAEERAQLAEERARLAEERAQHAEERAEEAEESAERAEEPAEQVEEPDVTAEGAESESLAERQGGMGSRHTRQAIEALHANQHLPILLRRHYVKQGRSEITLFGGVIPSEPFVEYYPIGLRYDFYPLESLGVEADGEYIGDIFRRSSDLETFLEDNGQHFGGADLQSWRAHLGVNWSPLYAKVAFLGQKLVHFDVTFVAALGAVGLEDEIHPEAELGLGLNFFLSTTFSLSADYRMFLFEKVAGGLDNPSELSLGVSAFF